MNKQAGTFPTSFLFMNFKLKYKQTQNSTLFSQSLKVIFKNPLKNDLFSIVTMR